MCATQIRIAQMVDAELRGSLHATAQLDDAMSCIWPVCNYTTEQSWPGNNITQAALSDPRAGKSLFYQMIDAVSTA